MDHSYRLSKGFKKLIKMFDDIKAEEDLDYFESTVNHKGTDENKLWISMRDKEKEFLSTAMKGRRDLFKETPKSLW